VLFHTHALSTLTFERSNKIDIVIGRILEYGAFNNLKYICMVFKSSYAFLHIQHTWKRRHFTSRNHKITWNIARVYNKLPSLIKEITAYNPFVIAQKKFLIEKCYYNVKDFLEEIWQSWFEFLWYLLLLNIYFLLTCQIDNLLCKKMTCTL